MRIVQELMHPTVCKISNCSERATMAVCTPNKTVVFPLCDKHLNQLKDELNGEVIIEVPKTMKEVKEVIRPQEYYYCKKCGAKFMKPEELNDYKRHCLTAHPKDK